MPTRDQEIDEFIEQNARRLQQPYIEQPPEKDVREGSMCFLDRTRFCGADCTAFNVEVESIAPADQCLILGSGLVLLRDVLARLAKPTSAELLEELRRIIPKPAVPPPDPFGQTIPARGRP